MVCLVAAAVLVLGGAVAPNGVLAPQGRQRGGHERVRLLAAVRASGAWSGIISGWSGYVVPGGAGSEVAATFTVPMVPTVYCESVQNGAKTYFWAGIESKDSNGNLTIVQAGIEYRCLNGQPYYSAFWVPDAYSGGVAVSLPDPVQPYDRITVGVYEIGGGYWVVLDDAVQNWSAANYVSDSAASAVYTAVAAESFNGGAYFDPVAVTGAQVNWAPLGQSNPQPWEQNPSIYHGSAGLDPSGLDASGQDFNFYWNVPPSL